VAIIIVLNQINGNGTKKVTFVTGEGDRSKVELMRSIVEKSGFKDPTTEYVYLDGMRSDKYFPMGIYTTWGVEIPPEGATNIEASTAAIVAAVGEARVLICIKPPRELYNHKFLGTEMALYGSFNLRCMRKDSKEMAQWINESFSRVLVYESFIVTGGQNTINPQNGKSFWEAVDKLAVGPQLIQHVREWNNYIATDCGVDVQAYATAINSIIGGVDPNATKETSACSNSVADFYSAGVSPNAWEKMVGGLERNLKVLKNIIDADGMQMVVADMGLAAALSDQSSHMTEYMANLSYNGAGYTVPVKPDTPAQEGRVWFVSPVTFDVMADAMARLLGSE
jgi:hypothetical protein